MTMLVSTGHTSTDTHSVMTHDIANKRSPALDSAQALEGVIGGLELARSLGFSNTAALRKAAQRNSLPVNTFHLPNRRGRFAMRRELAVWLEHLRLTAKQKHSHITNIQKSIQAEHNPTEEN